ncbi:TPA: hypothetical protein ACH3X3_006888 [Trebouxia sp. C0006]
MHDDIFDVSDTEEQKARLISTSAPSRTKLESPGGNSVKRKASVPAEPSGSGGSIKLLRGSEPAVPEAEVAPECRTDMHFATAEDKGSRLEMEDICIVLPDARQDKQNSCRVSYMAVFDGHAGQQVAQMTSRKLHSNVISQGLLAAASLQGTSLGSHQIVLDIKAMRKAISAGFALTDQQVLAQAEQHRWVGGAVCAAAWIVDNTVFVANTCAHQFVYGSLFAAVTTSDCHAHQTLGDVSCVLARTADTESSAVPKAIVLTKEHKALFPAERKRIEKAGGIVTNARLQGKTEVSRSFGNIHYKRLGMSAVPDIQVFNITPQDRFLLCACDGFWSCFGPQDAVKVVADLCQTGRPLKSVCERLVYMAVRERRCKDNCTVLLASFNRENAVIPD